MKRESSYFQKMKAAHLTYRIKTAGSLLNASGSMIAMLLYERSLNNLTHVISNNTLNIYLNIYFCDPKYKLSACHKPEF